MATALGLAAALPFLRASGAGAAPEPSEKVSNPTLQDGTGMATPQGGWTVGDGSAENTIMLRQLQFVTTGELTDGMEPQIQINVSANPNVATIQIEALKTSDNTFQLLGDEAMGQTGLIDIPGATVAGGPYDVLRIRCAGDSGVIITYFSVIA